MKVAARIAVGLLVALVGAGAVAGGLYWAVTMAPGPLVTEQRLVIPKGSAVPEIAQQLDEAGVVESALLFRVAAQVTSDNAPLRAGEYAFPANATIIQVLELLRSGRTVIRKLTIPEGLTTAQVLQRLNAAEGLEGEITTEPEEGSLLPATYPYTWGDSRPAMLDKMTEEMRRAVTKLWNNRAPDLPLDSPRDAVTLASIVEKETGVATERPRIAGVFINRLRLGMRLQSDPTVIYAVVGGAGPLGRPLTLADLRTDNPYNTYRVIGLPPGPIANPGRAALAAVMKPATSDELFFVADGSGGHAFAKTYEDHKANVARWRALKADDSDDSEGEGGN